VNLAARLESSAPAGIVVVDEDTAAAVETALPGAFVVDPGDEVDLQGIGRVATRRLRRGDSARLDLGL
jgi:adenylate cyclase